MQNLSVFYLMIFLIATLNATPFTAKHSLASRKSQRSQCSPIIIDKTYYTLQHKKNISGIPADMSIHWKTGKIYFTLISNEMRMNLQSLSVNGEIERIKVEGLGQSTAIDNLNDVVYLATDNGVYKYKDGYTELYTALGEDVMYIALTYDGLTMYIATWPQNRVQKITNDGRRAEAYTTIPNGHGLAIDQRDNIYFIASKTSYILKYGYQIPIKIQGLPEDNMIGIFVTNTNIVYAVDEGSNIYGINPESAKADYLGTFNVSGVNTFAMDASNNIYIGVKDAILKFAAQERNPCSDANSPLRY